MRLTLDILPAAILDITEAARWYEEQAPGSGIQFVTEINRKIDELADLALTLRVRYRRKNVRWTYPFRFHLSALLRSPSRFRTFV